MTEAARTIFTDICTNITDMNKDTFSSSVNQIRHIITDFEIDDYFEKLSLLGLGMQLALLTKHYRSEWFTKELCALIASEGRNYFKDDMNSWLKMAETGLASEGDNLVVFDDIDFTARFFYIFCSGIYPNYKQIVFNLRSIPNGKFAPSKEYFTICFALYFILVGYYYDFPDNDVKTIINLLNYYMLVPEKDRLDHFNIEVERVFANYIHIDFSERRHFYTDLPFIYKKIAEKKEKSDGEITIASKNKSSVKTKIKMTSHRNFKRCQKVLKFSFRLKTVLIRASKMKCASYCLSACFSTKEGFEKNLPKRKAQFDL